MVPSENLEGGSQSVSSTAEMPLQESFLPCVALLTYGNGVTWFSEMYLAVEQICMGVGPDHPVRCCT